MLRRLRGQSKGSESCMVAKRQISWRQTLDHGSSGWFQGYSSPVPAAMYSDGECGMPLDCVAALLAYHDSLAWDHSKYYDVQYLEPAFDEESFDGMFPDMLRVQRVDPEGFVGRLGAVNVSTFLPVDSKCFRC